MAANPNLTPLQFLRQYHDLMVGWDAADGSIEFFRGIKLQRYYINYRGPSPEEIERQIQENEKDGLTDEEKKENRTLRKKKSKAQKTASIESLVSKLRRGKARNAKFKINEARYGKGLPEDYELFLEAALAAGMCNVGKNGPPTRQSIQRFLDNSRLGIDCSGYASAYFVARGDLPQSTKDKVTRLGAAGWGERKGNERIERIGDIRMGDCLVVVKRNGKLKRGPGHIMLANGPGTAETATTLEFKPLNVHSGKGGGYLGESNGSVYICESRGGGLKHGPAAIRAGYPNKRHPYFQIRRHGLAEWLRCIVVRPNFKKAS